MLTNLHRWPARSFWFLTGGLALLLGAVGAVLPILPTTPFVILSAFAFGKSCPRLQVWLESRPVFGPAITDWRTHGAIAPRYKAISVLMMAGALGLGLASALPLAIKLLQAVLVAAGAWFILCRPNPLGCSTTCLTIRRRPPADR